MMFSTYNEKNIFLLWSCLSLSAIFTYCNQLKPNDTYIILQQDFVETFMSDRNLLRFNCELWN